MDTRELSRRTIERDVERAIRFLGALSRSPRLRRVMAQEAGYTEEDHQRGWALTLTVLGRAPATSPRMDPQRPLEQERAVAELDQWDGPAFDRARATLSVRYPEALRYLFTGLSAGTGTAAVGTVQTFLGRVAQLRDGTDPERAATREHDKEAAALLERRRIVTPEIEAHLRILLDQAKELAPEPLPEPDLEDTAEYREAAFALHVWLIDWRGQARALIRRRDCLISLGLASRRTGASMEAEEEPEDTVEADEEAMALEPA